VTRVVSYRRSLGAVAYHCLAGHPPFTGEAALEVAMRHLNDEVPPLPEDVPEPVRALVGRALAKDPADRYPTAGALAAAARAALAEPAGERPAVATGPGAAYADPATLPDLAVVPIAPAAPRPSRRRKATIAAAAATGLLAVAGVTVVLALSAARSKPPAGVDSPVPSTAPASPSGRARSARPGRPSQTASTSGSATPLSPNIPTSSAGPGGSISPTAQPAPASIAPSVARTTSSPP
jgi:eukaryotic-like serine/threonine-protein kinase